MTTTTERTGLWLVGAGGSVAATVACGLAALRAGVVSRTGLVTAQADLEGAGLIDTTDLVTGDTTSPTSPSPSVPRRSPSPAWCPTTCRHWSPTSSTRPRPASATATSSAPRASATPSPGSPPTCVTSVSAKGSPGWSSSTSRRRRHPSCRTPPTPTGARWSGPGMPASHRSRRARSTPRPRSPPAAPSSTSRRRPAPACPRSSDLAEEARLPWAGSDGKTGETLLKSVLAPMFAMRYAARCAPGRASTCSAAATAPPSPTRRPSQQDRASKAAGLEAMLGHTVEGPLHIDYVADLGDWKTAWDHVTFAGFLGTRMTLQFTWQGCDSALAAPLVLDLARLLDRRARGRADPGRWRSSASSSRTRSASDEHALAAQQRTSCVALGDGGSAARRDDPPGPCCGARAGPRGAVRARRRRSPGGGAAGWPAGRRTAAAARARRSRLYWAGMAAQRLGRPRAGRRGAPGAPDPVRAGRRRGRRSASRPGSPPPGWALAAVAAGGRPPAVASAAGRGGVGLRPVGSRTPPAGGRPGWPPPRARRAARAAAGGAPAAPGDRPAALLAAHTAAVTAPRRREVHGASRRPPAARSADRPRWPPPVTGACRRAEPAPAAGTGPAHGGRRSPAGWWRGRRPRGRPTAYASGVGRAQAAAAADPGHRRPGPRGRRHPRPGPAAVGALASAGRPARAGLAGAVAGLPRSAMRKGPPT